MQKKTITKVRGMNRDLSNSNFSAEFAFENRNIRITPTDDNTLLSLCNEKGPAPTSITGVGQYLTGIPIGYSVLENTLIIFTTTNSIDRIFKLWYENDTLKGEEIFVGRLNFNSEFPIETLPFYENDSIKKIYWVDGRNQPRVINLSKLDNLNNNSFDFIKKLDLVEQVTITKQTSDNGIFDPGTIQYCFSYFNSYGQESNIFYTSPLYYTSYESRGGSEEDKINNSFSIRVDKTDSDFDWVRVYSVHRSSIDATPTVKRVVDLKPEKGVDIVQSSPYPCYTDDLSNIKIYNYSGVCVNTLNYIEPDSSDEDSAIWYFDAGYKIVVSDEVQDEVITADNNSYIKIEKDFNRNCIFLSTDGKFLVKDNTLYTVNYSDNGTSGEVIDPTLLLYIGGEEIIASTLEQKDNTMFLGNIQLKRSLITEEIKNSLRSDLDLTFDYNGHKKLPAPSPKGLYPYKNQLYKNSQDIKIFKYLETYRLGIQFQHVTGKWSEPVWLGDIKNDKRVDARYVRQLPTEFATATYIISSSIASSLRNLGYIKARPVVVYPELSDRECICQGILCPTVYNIKDRYSGAVTAQSSWFTRPNKPFNYEKGKYDFQDRQTGTGNIYDDYPASLTISDSTNSKAFIISQGRTFGRDISTLGTAVISEHNQPIQGSGNTYEDSVSAERLGEIQCIFNPPDSPLVSIEGDVNEWVSKNQECFFVDQSIVTLHSPDIEFDTDIQNIDPSNLKLRIVGVVPITSSNSDIDIQADSISGASNKDTLVGFYKEKLGVSNISGFGYRQMVSGMFWLDTLKAYSNVYYGFAVYPWHRNGSLNEQSYNSDSESLPRGYLDKKKMSVLRYSYNNYYLDYDQIWNAESTSVSRPGISGAAIFNSNETTLIKLPAPKNSGLSEISYYGNIDTIIVPNLVGDKSNGYPIISSNPDLTSAHQMFISPYQQAVAAGTKYWGKDIISMKYKSTPHAVVAFNYELYTTSNKSRQFILPTLVDSYLNDGVITGIPIDSKPFISASSKYFWEETKKTTAVNQSVINVNFSNVNNSKDGIGPEYGYLWLGELYNDSITSATRFGGQTESAFENNKWLPCGNSMYLNGTTQIEWSEGDTYYQRYDHLKTYPFTLEDQNSIVDIVSFMCETRINLDGRYDKNRGQYSNLVMTPTNFNLINEAYSQKNNFFVYRGINADKLNLDKFSNLITWTKTKTLGELVDTWTNITLASTLDLDGNKGAITSINKLNNELIVFQEKGISNLLFNSRTQLAVNEGLPVEIANSGKVDGKVYISNNIGCPNKWSICETPNGLYFIDSITKGIYLFNGKLSSLSESLGFHSWINNNLDGVKAWNPLTFDDFVTYYDSKNKDVLFISKDECLAYSELLGQFSSFYSYNNVPYFINLNDKSLMVKKGLNNDYYYLWMHQQGDYNMYFGKYQPFSTTIISNDGKITDKIFNTLEFRSDTWDENNNLLDTTFNKLYTWNEYQEGESDLVFKPGYPSTLKRKFRIWRANIPRDNVNKRDRMRNPWLYIKLAQEKSNTNKTVLHDLVVSYFD